MRIHNPIVSLSLLHARRRLSQSSHQHLALSPLEVLPITRLSEHSLPMTITYLDVAIPLDLASQDSVPGPVIHSKSLERRIVYTVMQYIVRDGQTSLNILVPGRIPDHKVGVEARRYAALAPTQAVHARGVCRGQLDEAREREFSARRGIWIRCRAEEDGKSCLNAR